MSSEVLSKAEWHAVSALSGAKDKNGIVKALQAVYENRDQLSASYAMVGEALGISSAESVIQVAKGLSKLCTEALYHGWSAQELQAAFPSDFHAKLAQLLAALLSRLVVQWRQKELDHGISLPKLKSLDWRIDIKTASESNQQMSVPTLLVQLAVEDSAVEDTSKLVQFELTPATLDSMLDGLSKIRSQLGAIANSTSQ